MYSIIPTPKVSWDKENMKYAICFLPLIGLVIGFFEYLWFSLVMYLGLNLILYACVASLLPVIISGGIHMDGFIDTCDAIFSYAPPQKKLEILKDPRTGAFGVLGCVLYFVISFGLYSQFADNPKFILLLVSGFIVSRILSGLVLVSFKMAKTSGLAYLFSQQSLKKFIFIVLLTLLVASLIFLSISWPILTLIIILMITFLTIWYYFWSDKEFGGITGDLIGFYLVIVELIFLTVTGIGGAL